MLYRLLRPLLFCFPPEVAHRITFTLLKYVLPTCWLRYRVHHQIKHPVSCFGLNFPNPVGMAAGLDKNGDYLDLLFSLGFGFIEVGGVTPQPQMGNPKPRLFRLVKARALINRMGFNNRGVDYLVKNLQRRKVPGIVGVNLAKNKATPLANAIDDYRYCMQRVYAHVDYIVINISSPNTPGLRELQGEKYLETLLKGLDETRNQLAESQQRRVPLVLKLAPDMAQDQLASIAKQALRYHFEGLVLTNTSVDHSVVSELVHGDEQGGLSGAPIFQQSTQLLSFCHSVVGDELSLVGVGGIDSAATALQKFAAGAKLVQLYTGLIYRGPGLIKKILKSLKS